MKYQSINIRINIIYKAAVIILCCCLPFVTSAQSLAVKQKIQAKLDSFCIAGKFPGLTAGVVFPDNTVAAFASGTADSAHHLPMTTNSYLMQGSVGKTYVSAAAMQLIKEGKFS